MGAIHQSDQNNLHGKKMYKVSPDRYHKMMVRFRRQHPTNKFVGGCSLTTDGRIRWRSVGNIKKNDVIEVIKFSKDYNRYNLHLNSGTHGNHKGETIFTSPKEFLKNQNYLEGANIFLQEDVETSMNLFPESMISL